MAVFPELLREQVRQAEPYCLHVDGLFLTYIFSRPNENLAKIDLSEDAINTGLIVVMANTEDVESLINSQELKITISVSLN